MRIMTTKRFCFYTPDRKEKFVTQGNRIIEDCPEWAQSDLTFKAAIRDGSLTCLAKMEAVKEVDLQESAPANAHEAKKVKKKG